MIRTLTAAGLVAMAAALGAASVANAEGPYANCSQAKADGRSDIPQGDPDYWNGGDRDQDGIACES